MLVKVVTRINVVALGVLPVAACKEGYQLAVCIGSRIRDSVDRRV